MSLDQTPSVDEKEVAYYNALADTWWQLDGPFWPLHKLNECRIQWMMNQWRERSPHVSFDQPLAGVRVLDIGCGGGILSVALARLGADVTGIDVAERNIEVAKAYAQQQALTIDYRYTSAEALAQQGDQFDIVCNMEVVEHVASLPSFMTAVNALVKPGGLQFVATINRNWLAYFVAIFGAEQVFRLLPKGTHQYRKLVKPSELTEHLTAGGLSVEASTGVAVNPILRRMKTIPFLAINYMMLAHKRG